MALTTLTKKVLNFSEIPNSVKKDHWLTLIDNIELKEVHIENDPQDKDPVVNWINTIYPELQDEDSFYINLKA
jgi:hypothetical protein